MSDQNDPKHTLNTSNEYEISKTKWMWIIGVVSFFFFVAGVVYWELRSA